MTYTIDPKLHSVIVNSVIFDGDKVLVSQATLEPFVNPLRYNLADANLD